MGFNTVAVLFNDMTHWIAQSGPVGERIASAMQSYSQKDRHPVALDFGCGAVISQAHADCSQIVVVGQNCGRPLSECNDLDWMAINELKKALIRHGYRVTKVQKPRAKAEGQS